MSHSFLENIQNLYFYSILDKEMTFIIYIKKLFRAILKYNTQIKMNNRFTVYASIFAFESTYLQNLTLIFAFEFAFFTKLRQKPHPNAYYAPINSIRNQFVIIWCTFNHINIFYFTSTMF